MIFKPKLVINLVSLFSANPQICTGSTERWPYLPGQQSRGRSERTGGQRYYICTDLQPETDHWQTTERLQWY